MFKFFKDFFKTKTSPDTIVTDTSFEDLMGEVKKDEANLVDLEKQVHEAFKNLEDEVHEVEREVDELSS